MVRAYIVHLLGYISVEGVQEKFWSEMKSTASAVAQALALPTSSIHL